MSKSPLNSSAYFQGKRSSVGGLMVGSVSQVAVE